MKDAGWDHSDKKSNGKGGGGNDLWKDKKGNVYEKPKSGAGTGEWTGYNLNNLTISVGVGATVLGGIKLIFDWTSKRAMPFLTVPPLMMETINPQPIYKREIL